MNPKTCTGKDYEKYNLSGKIALVTGVGGEFGIGRAIAMRLAEDGADFAISDLTQSLRIPSGSDWDGLPQVVDEIRTLECRSIGIAAEVSKSDQVENMVRKVIGEFCHIEILVNNAGALAGPRSRHWTG